MNKIKAIFGTVAGKLRGKALKVAVTAVFSLGCIITGFNPPEPVRQAFVSGSVVLIEAFLSDEQAVDDEGEDAGID